MEKKLSFAQELKQKLKGTWDSPCIEVCSYKMGHPFCRACGMLRAEKKAWHAMNSIEKADARATADNRMRTLVHVKTGTSVQ